MSDTPTKPDLFTQNLCDQLDKLVTGCLVIGIEPHVVKRASKKLAEQYIELAQYRAMDPYKAGHADGHKEAFATGLTDD